MNTSNSPLEYLAAFAIVLASGALLGFALGWRSAETFCRSQCRARDRELDL